MVDLYQSVSGETRNEYYLVVVGVFLLLPLSFVLSCPLSPFLNDCSIVAVVSVSLVIIRFFASAPFN